MALLRSLKTGDLKVAILRTLKFALLRTLKVAILKTLEVAILGSLSAAGQSPFSNFQLYFY